MVDGIYQTLERGETWIISTWNPHHDEGIGASVPDCMQASPLPSFYEYAKCGQQNWLEWQVEAMMRMYSSYTLERMIAKSMKGITSKTKNIGYLNQKHLQWKRKPKSPVQYGRANNKPRNTVSQRALIRSPHVFKSCQIVSKEKNACLSSLPQLQISLPSQEKSGVCYSYTTYHMCIICHRKREK